MKTPASQTRSSQNECRAGRGDCNEWGDASPARTIEPASRRPDRYCRQCKPRGLDGIRPAAHRIAKFNSRCIAVKRHSTLGVGNLQRFLHVAAHHHAIGARKIALQPSATNLRASASPRLRLRMFSKSLTPKPESLIPCPVSRIPRRDSHPRS